VLMRMRLFPLVSHARRHVGIRAGADHVHAGLSRTRRSMPPSALNMQCHASFVMRSGRLRRDDVLGCRIAESHLNG
jgi:hypothetical protein